LDAQKQHARGFAIDFASWRAFARLDCSQPGIRSRSFATCRREPVLGAGEIGVCCCLQEGCTARSDKNSFSAGGTIASSKHCAGRGLPPTPMMGHVRSGRRSWFFLYRWGSASPPVLSEARYHLFLAALPSAVMTPLMASL